MVVVTVWFKQPQFCVRSRNPSRDDTRLCEAGREWCVTRLCEAVLHENVTQKAVLDGLFTLLPPQRNQASVSLMSSTGQATSSTNFQLIIDNALADYEKVTGIDLSRSPFAAKIEQSNSPEDILQLLQERENAFREYRNSNRKLISCLKPSVVIIQAFSTIQEAVSLVSRTS